MTENLIDLKKPISKNIIFLIAQPLDSRNYDRFGIDFWIKKGWEVKVLDLTPLLFPKVWDNFKKQGNELKEVPFYFPIHDRQDIAKRVESEQTGLFVDLIEMNINDYLKIKLVLLTRGFYSLTLRMGAVPLPVSYNAGTFERVSTLLKNIVGREKSVFSIINHLFLKVYYERLFNPFKSQFFRAVSGNITYQEARHTIPADQIIKVHNFDYDQYLIDERALEPSSEKYILFLDEDMAYHSDFIYQNISGPVKPEIYFSTMNSGLSHIASHFNCELKIAAHPRSNYTGLRSNCYGNTSLYKGKTAELIKSAQLVIGHTSTSLQLAVLYKKPILFVTTDEILNSSYQDYIDKYSVTLKRPIVNLNAELHKVEWDELLDVDEVIYRNYKHDYIKCSNTPEKFSMEIVESYFIHQ